MYPLLLKAPIKDYIWGGTRLIDEFGFKTDKSIAAEGWMLSCHKDGTNTVINGEYAGMGFDDVLKLWGYNDKFPVLIKLIDAKQKLSVQVHPDNAYALVNEGEYGKTETFYDENCVLFKDLPATGISWMSHGDYISAVPEGFRVTAHTAVCPTGAMANDEKKLYGVQFHPEVNHTENGKDMLYKFLYDVCGCQGEWKMEDYIENTVKNGNTKTGCSCCR